MTATRTSATPRNTKKKLTRQERFDRALPELTRARDEIIRAIASVHPETGCLPISELELPATPEAVRATGRAVFLTIWTPSGNHGHHADWRKAIHGGCPHLVQAQVINLCELMIAWYQLLSATYYYVDNVQPFADWQTVEQQEELHGRLNDLATGRDPRRF